MKNIVLIGMPASGKSTAGVLLAKAIGYGFIDTDLLIQNRERALLCDIIQAKGAEEFLRIEEQVNSELWAEHCVISTGGSVIYGEKAMLHLKELGTVVYLKLSEPALEKRLKNIFRRGVVMRTPGETVAQLYAERVPLYEKYADVTIDCEGHTVEETVQAIAEAVSL
ncbi:MAG TPA: shikimate kinase [Candidatus Borkfalkia faecipullorum]|uniref:Shikimate kinase n=1 Tax=Candidatus Borkfalkia faecipullorum TaxID=2838510 RepID=A0A9D2AG49_9FIRM|nr:shikimate kinase [Candidatus Borkfalkia faecipullorum]